MGSSNLKGRLEKLEAKCSSGRVTWRLEDGREVSFSSFEMLKARYDLFSRVYEAWCGEELPPLDGVLAALLNTTEEERQRLADSVPWVAWFSYEMDRIETPPEDAIRLANEHIAVRSPAREGLE